MNGRTQFNAQRARQRKPKMTPVLRRSLEKEMGKIGFALNQLLSRSALPWNIGKKRLVLDPEQKLSVGVADRLRELTQEYYDSNRVRGLRAVWCHVANERQAGWFTFLLLKAMGMLTGALDYWFVWEGGGGLIELKVDGDLSPEQEYFITWSQGFKVPCRICRNVDDVIDTLIGWGAIVGIPPRCAVDVT